MDDKDFYQLCYEQYRAEMTEAHFIYQRAAVLLTSLPILSAAAYALGRTDLLARMFERVDLLLYHVALGLAFLFIATSTYYLVRSVSPRKDYRTLASMKKWKKWRTELKDCLAKEHQGQECETLVSKETLRSLIGLLSEAQTKNEQLNEVRRKQFGCSIKIAGWAIAAVGVEAFFRLILHIQGI